MAYERFGGGGGFRGRPMGGMGSPEDDGPGISGDKPDVTTEVLALPFPKEGVPTPEAISAFKALYSSKAIESVKSPFSSSGGSAMLTAIGWNRDGSVLAVAGGSGSDHQIKLYELSSSMIRYVASQIALF